MRPFAYTRANSAKSAIENQAAAFDIPLAPAHSVSEFVAGGTTLIDLMKLNVMQPETVVDINALERTPSGRVDVGPKGLRLGALVRMSAAAEHPSIKANYPLIAQSLALAASPQIRNMASLGGNVLQRTRCTYFRDVSYPACNKRKPGSGCAALGGFNRSHAVLGTSEHCIASYPGDFAQALIALDAEVEIGGPRGSRTLPFSKLHRVPAETPHLETTLAPGELIMAFEIPPMPWARRSLYLKIRDRESYEFALASAAVAIDLDGGTVRQARIALGGVAAVPWRAYEAEKRLVGRELDDATLQEAAEAAFAPANPYKHNEFKIALGKQTMIRALRQAAAMEL
jgi:xanthine dehydrogenase YagS FAD-binding subunit